MDPACKALKAQLCDSNWLLVISHHPEPIHISGYLIAADKQGLPDPCFAGHIDGADTYPGLFFPNIDIAAALAYLLVVKPPTFFLPHKALFQGTGLKPQLDDIEVEPIPRNTKNTDNAGKFIITRRVVSITQDFDRGDIRDNESFLVTIPALITGEQVAV